MLNYNTMNVLMILVIYEKIIIQVKFLNELHLGFVFSLSFCSFCSVCLILINTELYLLFTCFNTNKNRQILLNVY